MDTSVKVKILLGLTIIGALYGVTFHTIIVPFAGAELVHCVVSGVLLGLANYLLVALVFKYSLVKKNNSLLRSELRVDKLTQLLNRTAFDEDINLFTFTEEVVAIVFIDIDNFAIFNNKYGHQVGDTVLKNVSNAIKESIRATDLVYRYGGEEMVVVLRNCTKVSATEIAEKIRANVSEIENVSYPGITVSIGVASYPEDAADLLSAVKKSDFALLNAKEQGKNRVVSNET